MSYQDLVDAASRDLAQGEAATPGEAFGSAFRLMEETGGTLSAGRALYDEYQGYVEQLRDMTGEDLPNPRALPADMRERAEQRLYERALKLREGDDRVPVRSPEDIRASIGQQRKALREARAGVERREVTTLSSIAGFAGSAVGAFTDPPLLASMAFGAPWSAGIIRGALIDAGISVGTETVAQAVVQAQRRQFGEKPDLGEAAMAVAAAGAGGLVLSGAIRAGARAGAGALERIRASRTEVDDALAYLERIRELEELAPVTDEGIPARALHAERLDAAMNAVRDGRVARLDGLGEGGVTPSPEAGGRAADVSASAPPAELPAPRQALPVRAKATDELTIPEAPESARGAAPARGQAAPLGEEPVRGSGGAEPIADPVEAHVRGLYAGREHAELIFETPEGATERMTAREMFDEIERQREHLEVLKICLTGSGLR